MDEKRSSVKAFLYAVIIILSSIIVYSIPPSHAEPFIQNAGDLDPKVVAKQLSECESEETRFRSAMPRLREIWAKKAALKKEKAQRELAHQKLNSEYEEANKAFKQASNTRGKLSMRCKEAWKKSGISDEDWNRRWHEIKECREFDEFERSVYRKKLSAAEAKYKERELHEKKLDEFLRGKLFDVDVEYSHALFSLYYSDEDIDPDTYLRNITDRCNKLRAAYRIVGYDPAVRAQKAITECKFPEADKYIGEIPAGQKKAALGRNLADARAREVRVKEIYQAGKDIYNRGRAEEQAGRYDSARALYQDAFNRFRSARDMSRCEDRMPTIYKALSVTQGRLAEVQGRQPPRQQRAEQRFDKPMVGGVPLDYCKTWATNCGKPAADYFCIKNHYSGAVRWETSRVQQTRILSTNTLCQVGKNSPICDAFSYIICK